MSCSRCIRTAFPASAISSFASRTLLRPATKPTSHTSSLTVSSIRPAQRAFSILSSIRRPTLSPKASLLESTTTTTAAATSSTSTQSTSPLSQPLGLSTQGPLSQVRGAKRNSFNPSHVVRKRRHGYLSRVRTRKGRKMLMRRRMRGVNLSH